MKTITLLVMLISLAAGCSHMLHQERGSGNVQRLTRDVEQFKSISTEGAFEIDVVSQKPFGVQIEGDDNILPLIVTDVSGGVLHIKSQRGYSVSKPIKIEISVPTLEGLTLSGAGRVTVNDLKAEKFEVDINGAPGVELSGETNLLKIKANGAGTIDTHRLRAARAEVNTNGVSNISLHVRDQLDVVVSGPSHVTYEGDPVVNKTVNGPGSVQKKASQGS